MGINSRNIDSQMEQRPLGQPKHYHTNLEMLFSLILLTLCAFAATAEDSESSESSSEQTHDNEHPRRYVEALMDCSEKYQVPPNYFTMILNGDAPVFNDAKCFVKCGMMGLHYLNEDGSLNEKEVRSVVHRFFAEPSAHEQAINTWLNCEKQSKSEQYADDSCERAYNMFMCYSEHMSKCFMKCGLVGMGYINRDGSLNGANLKNTVYKYFNDESQRDFTIRAWLACDQKCHSAFYSDDSCDRAFNLAMCFVEQIKNVCTEQI
ncbi:unnamed protein product [Nezara viridula]|uniref:Uncharacterized protein n=1 Tax=Nezara viridula TaxID=85310 RepID=A0A9P0H3C2_NEZVI|nr:unnamed protein product [Nezara viridula]